MQDTTAVPGALAAAGFGPSPDYSGDTPEDARREWEKLTRYVAELRASLHERKALPTSKPLPRGPRSRGAGRPAVRGASRRSSARSGDSGSEDGEAEPPSTTGRHPCLCGCGASLDHKRRGAKYLNPTHRQRGQRARDHEHAGNAKERRRQDAVKRGLPGKPAHCRCGGRAAYPFDHRWICVLCGLPKKDAYSEVNGHIADQAILDILREEARRGVHVGVAPWPWRARLKGHEMTDLRRRDRERGYELPRIPRKGVKPRA
jgi:hypothetical protein